MLGFGAIGQFALGQISIAAPTHFINVILATTEIDSDTMISAINVVQSQPAAIAKISIAEVIWTNPTSVREV